MSDWMHCNKCSFKYNNNIKFFLTECGHLFCERCINPRESKCTVCEKSTKAITITKDMDATIQQYFMPLESHIKKLLEVYNFQMQHRTRLFQALVQKYNYAKKECISAHNNCKNIGRENKMLRSMLMSANQGKQQPFQTSTPAMKPNMTPTDNMSAMSSIGFTPSIRGGAAAGPGLARRMFSSGGGNFIRGFPPVPPSGGSSMRSSLIHVVPNMGRKADMPPVHKLAGPSFSMEQLRRSGKHI